MEEQVTQDTNVTQDINVTQTPEQTVDTQITPEQTVDVNVTPQQNNINNITIDTNKDLGQNLIQNAVKISRDTNLNENNGKHFDQFMNEYDYDPSESGSYWVAGAINDIDTQMGFLNSLIYEEMYDEMDLQKYYYDSQLATARAYAASKEREIAYNYYRAAQERAISEAQLTGWYMPAEGKYMLGQYSIAQMTLEDPDADDESRAKASRIASTTEKWFNANSITKQGIKCLSRMNYEETVRSNKVNERLQEQANQINAASNAINSKLAELNLKQFKFKVEEMELLQGVNYSKQLGLDTDNTIGHHKGEYFDAEGNEYAALRGYDTIQEALINDQNVYESVLGYLGEDMIRNMFGTEDEYNAVMYNWKGAEGDAVIEESVEANGNVIALDSLDKQGAQITIGNSKYNIYALVSRDEDGTPHTRLYYVNAAGGTTQITDGNTKISKTGKTVAEVYYNFTGDDIKYKNEDGAYETVYVENNNLSSKKGSITELGRKTFMTMDKDSYESLVAEEESGHEVQHGIISTEGNNSPWVTYDKATGTYYDIGNDTGSINAIEDKENLIDVHINENGKVTMTHADGSKLTDWQNKWANREVYLGWAISQSVYIGETKNGNRIYRYYNSDGTYVNLSTAGSGNLYNSGSISLISAFSSQFGDSYSAFSRGAYYKIISDEEISKTTDTFDKSQAIEDYINGIEYTTVESADTRYEKKKETTGSTTEEDDELAIAEVGETAKATVQTTSNKTDEDKREIDYKKHKTDIEDSPEVKFLTSIQSTGKNNINKVKV